MTTLRLVCGALLLCTYAMAQEATDAARAPARETAGEALTAEVLTAEVLTAEVLTGEVLWSARVPAQWNGTLLLHSRGWSPVAGQPQVGPAAVVDALLAQGYALAGSNYGAGGWALAEALPAQEAVLDQFTRRYGEPRRVIAYGYSMGGLVTTALVEREQPRVHGGIAFCSSMGGALGMMNMGLDGAFVFRELVAPDAGIAVVGIVDDAANGRAVAAAAALARETPAGRARIALASVLAGIPTWTRADAPDPAGQAPEDRLEQLIEAFPTGVFLPRSEQEQRAGGNFSWNEGIDYRELLEQSGRRDLVEILYAEAGISLEDDLATLDRSVRIGADDRAVDYMRRHYTPYAQPRVPLLAVQAFGDGVTSPSLQRVYAEHAPPGMMDAQYLAKAGHCQFDAAETLAALRHLEARLDGGEWPAPSAPFVPHEPAPMLRPCFQEGLCR